MFFRNIKPHIKVNPYLILIVCIVCLCFFPFVAFLHNQSCAPESLIKIEFKCKKKKIWIHHLLTLTDVTSPLSFAPRIMGFKKKSHSTKDACLDNVYYVKICEKEYFKAAPHLLYTLFFVFYVNFRKWFLPNLNVWYRSLHFKLYKCLYDILYIWWAIVCHTFNLNKTKSVGEKWLVGNLFRSL